MDEKLDQCIGLMQDTAKKADEIITDYKAIKRDNNSKDNIIRWLITALITFIVTAGIVVGIFFYGYLYSPYMSQITQSEDTSGNQVQVIGG